MQINKVMSLLDILTSWLEDNINMESGNGANLLI